MRVEILIVEIKYDMTNIMCKISQITGDNLATSCQINGGERVCFDVVHLVTASGKSIEAITNVNMKKMQIDWLISISSKWAAHLISLVN
jgi:hypothetical protein